MCYVDYNKETNKVKMIHYKPELLSDDKLDQMVEVDEIPPPEKDGFVRYLDDEKNEIYYEYEEEE